METISVVDPFSDTVISWSRLSPTWSHQARGIRFFFFFTRIHTNYTRAAFVEESEMKIKPREENDRSKELTELTVDQNYGHLAHANFSRLHPRRNSRLGIEQHVHGLTYASCEWLRKWELRRLEEGNCNGRWMEEQSQPRIYNAARHNISQANQLA